MIAHGLSYKKKAFLRWCHPKLLYLLAYIWRRLLFRTTFIAITGSVGKTTTKECIAAIFSAHFRTAKTLYNQNDFHGVPRTILRVRPWHRFAVVEIGSGRPGMVRTLSRLVRPHIAIVLAIARAHAKFFKTLDETAREKAQILETLSPEGLAILNADDPRVGKMRDSCERRVKMFGRSPGLGLWADEVSSKWPARLTLRVQTESETQWVKTNLVGEQWVNSILASLLAARSCGIPLRTAATDLERVKPFAARMQPVSLPSGATILRDESDGLPDTLEAALKVLKESYTARRVLVMSDISDSREKPRDRLRKLGKVASQVSDLAVFIGEYGHHAVKAAIGSGMKPECVLDFKDLYRAALYLQSELRSGDLVLLKGRATDHLSRVFFTQFGPIGCWKTKCRKTFVCDFCEDLKPEFDLSNIQSRDVTLIKEDY
jgi:UDP-N-acetylmuramoyl-tripeptide--D-alanyl-D-alanine ligase